MRKATIGSYSVRRGASIVLEDAHSVLLELRHRATRGRAVRDIVTNLWKEWWVGC